MGVHTGEATERDGDWFGTEVNRAARVMAVANGGQIVCTGAVVEQVRDDSTSSTSASIGFATCRRPVHLFQVEVHPGCRPSSRRCGRSTPTARTCPTS